MTNSMEQSPSSEADSHSAIQEIQGILHFLIVPKMFITVFTGSF
jgi:hypothetical protein